MANLQAIYIALFGRPADPLGLAWMDEATNGGTDYAPLYALEGTPEFGARFIGPQYDYPGEFVITIFEGLYDRQPEPEALNYFWQLYSATHSFVHVALTMMEAAQGNDVLTLQAKVDAAESFTALLDTEIEIGMYVGTDAVQFARDLIDPVNYKNPYDAARVEAEWTDYFNGQTSTVGHASSFEA